MILFSHPTGNQNSRQAALAFDEADALHRFVTAAHFDSHGLFAKAMPARIRKELERRDFSDAVSCDRVESAATVRELTRVIASRTGPKRLVGHETGWAGVDRVYRAVDSAVARRIERGATVDAVYAYEDGALESFKAARKRGIRRIYELPIGYWRTHRRLCEEEAQLQPAWAHTWHASADSDEKVRRKDEELGLASHVIVPSRFVADSLSEYPGELPPVSVIPYGCPRPIEPAARRWYAGGPLKVLFVGRLSQLKGLSYLLDAVAPLGNSVSLTIIGTGPGREFLGSHHRQLGSVPHMTVIEEMRRHDVFVFPSLFDGFGMVVTEALAQGLPVITTPATGASAMIDDGVQGCIVPIRDSAAITHWLQRCIDAPENVASMGRAALELSASWTWAHYRRALRKAILGSEAA